MNISTKTALAALVAAFVSVSGGAKASIIYDVSLSNGTEAVNGTITTDGNTGTLAPADFTAWNLTASGALNFTITSADATVAVECVAALTDCAEASSSSLTVTPLAEFLLASGTAAFATFDAIAFNSDRTLVEVQNALGGFSEADPALSAVAESGTVSAVPEPSSLAILAASLGTFGFGWLRCRRNEA